MTPITAGIVDGFIALLAAVAFLWLMRTRRSRQRLIPKVRVYPDRLDRQWHAARRRQQLDALTQDRRER